MKTLFSIVVIILCSFGLAFLSGRNQAPPQNPYIPVPAYTWINCDLTNSGQMILKMPEGQQYRFSTEKLRFSILLPSGEVTTYTWEQIRRAIVIGEVK